MDRHAPPVLPPSVIARALDDGRAAFNAGRFFEAHERWEDAWRALTDGPRGVVQGLIQIAAGGHHLVRGRVGPATRLLKKGARKVGAHASAPRPPFFSDVDLAAFAARIAQFADILAASGGSAGDLAAQLKL